MRQGDVIDGKYRIEVELGEGGMGRVFAATHTTLGSTVALKVLRQEALSSPEVPKRFLREAQAASRLRSEHVVRVSDIGTLPTGQPYIVMEMLHGHDLSSRLKKGPLPPAQALEYIVQACEGLAEAHGIGMVHRDVKPGNLFVTARPNGAALIKVLDFGIATAATGDLDPRLTSTQSVMGSPSYMSPEQLKGSRDVDARSDIWALGVTLYELLTGKQPFEGPTLTALSLTIVTEPHPPLEGFDPAIQRIVDRCLQKNPADRYPNVAELAKDLAPLIPGGMIAADLVAGSYKMPVPPTLLGLEQSLGTQPTMAPTRAPLNSSTTSLASGETGTQLPVQSRKWVWITAGLATIALGIGVGVMVGMSGGTSTATAAKPPVTSEPPKQDPPPPPPKVEEPKVEPKIEPKIEPPPVIEQPAKVEEPKVDPKTVAKKKRPPKKDPRVPVSPYPVKDPGKDPPKDPPKVDPPKVDPPKVDPPKKQPCAPNDPRCGL